MPEAGRQEHNVKQTPERSTFLRHSWLSDRAFPVPIADNQSNAWSPPQPPPLSFTQAPETFLHALQHTTLLHLGQRFISHHQRPATSPSHSLQILNPGLLAVAEQSAAHHGLLVHAQEAKACALCILITALRSPSRRRHL